MRVDVLLLRGLRGGSQRSRAVAGREESRTRSGVERRFDGELERGNGDARARW